MRCGGVARPVRNAPGQRRFSPQTSASSRSRKGEVGAALVVGDGVDLVDDDGADMAEVLAGFAGGEQQVERLGRGDEDVRRVAQHARALAGQRVAGADAGADRRAEIAARGGELLDLGERPVEVLLNVVGERLERRDVDDLCGGRERAGDGEAQQLVDGDQKRGERFARASGRGDERGFAAEDGGPALLLRLGGGAELGEEPLGHEGMSPGEGVVRAQSADCRSGCRSGAGAAAMGYCSVSLFDVCSPCR